VTDRQAAGPDDEVERSGPLAGVVVVECGSLIAGPFCGQLLADFGAEVIKIEDPVQGDPMRRWGPVSVQGHSLHWPVIARNKKCITADLRRAEGQELLRDLIAKADVVVENFRPGTLEKWGLGYDAMSAVNPGVILVRVSGYGQTGPYADRAGFGAIGEAMGGLRYLNGDPDRPPSRLGVSLGDSVAALFSAFGAVLALRSRDVTGRGQVVDTSIYEAVLGLMESVIPEWALAGHQRERSGSILPGVAPSNAYPTADGTDILIAANADAIFIRLAEVMGRPDLASDERFDSHEARGRNQAELDDLIATWTADQEPDVVLEILHAARVPAGKIYRAADMFADPHFADRGAIIRLKHQVLGDFPMQNVVPRLSETPGKVQSLGPGLGQHNEEIYAGRLGLSADKLGALREAGII
jgi:formyl-CoA transferase